MKTSILSTFSIIYVGENKVPVFYLIREKGKGGGGACTVEQRADVLIRIPLFILNPDCTEMIIGVDIFSRLCVWECGIYKALTL